MQRQDDVIKRVRIRQKILTGVWNDIVHIHGSSFFLNIISVVVWIHLRGQRLDLKAHERGKERALQRNIQSRNLNIRSKKIRNMCNKHRIKFENNWFDQKESSA